MTRPLDDLDRLFEILHGGTLCPTCRGKGGYSKITDDEMKAIMKNAVDYVNKFSVMKKTDPARYEKPIQYGSEVARQWDEPAVP